MRWNHALRWLRIQPYPVRWIFWILLYYYNKRKYPEGTFTLDMYKDYAKTYHYPKW